MTLAAPASSRARAMWTLYALSLRQHVHGKRWMILAALFALPAILAAVVRGTARDVPPVEMEFMFAFMFIPQAILPLAALTYASGMIQDEQEEQTITYLFMRPIPKWAIYLLKLMATLTTVVILTALFTSLTYAAVYMGRESTDNVALRCLKAVGIHSLAAIAYCCLFGLMSLLTKRILVVGVLYIAIVEGLLANLPFGIRLVTVIYYSRMIAYRVLSFIVPIPGGTENLAAESWQLDLRHDPHLLEHPQLRTCVLVLILASAALAGLAGYVCSRKEFYVKTPEKN